MSMSTRQTRILAQLLIEFENAHHDFTDSPLGAAFGVIETLRLALIRFTGVDGFRSLLSRALALSKYEAPSLAVVRLSGDGTLRLDESGETANTPESEADGAVLVACLLQLLVTFIGGSLTFRLVRDEWPELPQEIPSTGEGKP